MRTLPLQAVNPDVAAKLPKFTPSLGEAAIVGVFDIDYACDSCGYVLIRGMADTNHIRGIAFFCPRCKTWNLADF